MSDQNNNQYEDTYYIIPRYIRKLPGITLAYLDVYETIFQFWNKNKNCFLGEESLCLRTGYKRAVIYRALTFFENHNELKRIKKNGKRYLVKPEKMIETDCTENIPMSTAVDSNVYNRRLSTSTTVDHNIKKLNKESNYIYIADEKIPELPETNKITPHEYQETLYQEQTPETVNHQKLSDITFEQFWAIYPVKKNENRAKSMWFSQLCYERYELIMEKLKEQTQKDAVFLDGYAPNPDKYIAEERWKDEIQIRSKKKNTHTTDHFSDWDKDLDKDIL